MEKEMCHKKPVWCKTDECVWEAMSAIIFVGRGEWIPVCYQCENAIQMALNRLPSDAYDIVIVPIEDIGEYGFDQGEADEGL